LAERCLEFRLRSYVTKLVSLTFSVFLLRLSFHFLSGPAGRFLIIIIIIIIIIAHAHCIICSILSGPRVNSATVPSTVHDKHGHETAVCLPRAWRCDLSVSIDSAKPRAALMTGVQRRDFRHGNLNITKFFAILFRGLKFERLACVSQFLNGSLIDRALVHDTLRRRELSNKSVIFWQATILRLSNDSIPVVCKRGTEAAPPLRCSTAVEATFRSPSPPSGSRCVAGHWTSAAAAAAAAADGRQSTTRTRPSVLQWVSAALVVAHRMHAQATGRSNVQAGESQGTKPWLHAD
jgi:hypothetical protein